MTKQNLKGNGENRQKSEDRFVEQELIKKIQAGDHSAFEELFNNYRIMVFNVCFRIIGNQQEAEDVSQDVFFHAYKSIKRFRSESKISTWLYRITINLCLNYQRKKKLVYCFSLDFFLDFPTLPDSRPDVSLEVNYKKQIVRKAINSLPKQQRIAVILHRYEGLSYQEIAEVMDCSVASVESRLYRAKENLANKLLPILKNI